MFVPELVLTNDDLSAIMDTNDEWIRSRTGIAERRIASEKETTTTMALKAAQQALKLTQVLPSEVDLIIVATSTPENIFPSTASIVQHWLGATHAGAFDLSAACSGFVYGVEMASQAIRGGGIKTALVIGSETLSRVVNWEDRGTAILFGDGAGAVVLEARKEPGGVLASLLRSDGSGHDFLTIPTHNHPQIRALDPLGVPQLHKITMAGGEVFKFAVKVVAESIREVLEKAGISIEDVGLIVPHQANQRILQAAARNLQIDLSRFMVNLDRYGNTSAASIPIALCEAIEQGRIKAGQNIVFVGFGGGLTWASSVIRWGMGEPSVDHIRERRRQAGYFLVRWRTRVRHLRNRLNRIFRFFFGSEDPDQP